MVALPYRILIRTLPLACTSFLRSIGDALAGREVVRITAASTTASPPCIWRLLVLADGTVVSGDGEGAVQMWDGAFGTLLHRFSRYVLDD